MPCEVNTRFVILYGSQKGQAQSIAEGIAVEAEDHGLVAELSCLNQSEKYNLEKEKAPVVFIVSTTGDGEPPDNALQFVKGIKKKTLSTDHYKHLCYALLALGDTNYANFCNCGKTIERRLQALGAKQFYVTGYADDGVGLEVVVDPWLEGLWKAIKGALSKMASDKVDPLKGPSVRALAITDSKYARTASYSASDEGTTLSDDGGAPHVPLSSLNVPALPPPYLHVSLQDVDSREQVRNDVADEDIPIERAIQLTTGDLVKTSLLLELDTSAYPTMTYLPGDSFDVFCPNRATEVEDMLCRLGLQDKKHHQVHVSLNKDTKKKGAQVPSYIPPSISLLYLLTWCLEIRTVPKKAFLRALVEHTGDTVQRRRLQELCSKQGATEYNQYVRDPGLSILEVLTAFPSCSPPLCLLIEHLPKLQPRPYSAASSCLKHPGKLHFVFNVVEFSACSGRPVGRRGLCTGWLFDLINPGKPKCSGSHALPKIHVSLRPKCSFRLPSDLSVPFVMVGPGTGVAPFIGFLQQREKERQDNPEAVFGETWLFFGCRYRDRDYLFREELEGFVTSGVLDHLKVSFSRDELEMEGNEVTTSVARPRYVQHNLLLHRQQITEILLKKNGCLYVCGDAKNMAKDVNDTLIEIIKTQLQVDQLEAMKTLAGLREEKRYLQDIWG
uniref:Methionine synthase reductase n=1 Tax=Echeneis naucrates TaxID=173247 RepID=A0A665VER4_ECHNA